MLVIIAGSRSITDPRVIDQAVKDSGFQIDQVFHGGARGVDRLAEKWARRHKIPCTPFPARWRDREGQKNPGAGFARNQEMVQRARDADSEAGLIAIMYRDEPTPGTSDIIGRSQKAGLRVHIQLI